jgi:hypothetical protein
VAVLRTRTVLTLAATLVAVGALAYVGPRPDAPAPLAALVGTWPTLWLAAALVLAGTALAQGAGARRRAAAGWTAVALATEAVQHPALAALLFADGPGSSRFHPATYAHLGTFDGLDVAAALVGATIGWRLAVATRPLGAPARPAAAPRRLFGLARHGALLAVAVGATVATSPPPGPWVSVTLEPSVVCEGDEVRVAWLGHRGDADEPPDRGVLNAWPPTAFEPPLVDLEVAVPGTLDVVAVRSGGVGATPTPSAGYGSISALVHARPCDAAGRQYRHEVGRTVVALAATPGGTDVVAALDGYGGLDLLVRLDADANEVATAFVPGDHTSRVRDVVVAPDGTVVAVGWRRTYAETGTQAVVWRWPVGGDVDAGTVVGPTAPGTSAEGAAIALDAAGRTWVAWTEGPPGASVARIAAYAPDGTLEATRTLSLDAVTEAHALAIDAAGRPTLVVRSAATAGGLRSTFVHALDVDGTPRWERGPFASGTAAIATAAPGATLFLVDDALHALDDTTGAALWTTGLPDGRTGTHVAVDDAGAAVVAGPGPFLQRFALDGTPTSDRTFGSAGPDEVGALAWSGGAVVGGATEGALATTLIPDGRAEAFVLRFPDGAP